MTCRTNIPASTGTKRRSCRRKSRTSSRRPCSECAKRRTPMYPLNFETIAHPISAERRVTCKTTYADTDRPPVVAETCDNFVSCDTFTVTGGSCECWGATSIVNHFVCKPGACSVTLIGTVSKPRLYSIPSLGCPDVHKEVLNYTCETPLCHILCTELPLSDEVHSDAIDSAYRYGLVISTV